MGEKIREWRKQQQWTQQDLAVKLHVTVATVARWEAGRTQPSQLALEALLRFGFRE